MTCCLPDAPGRCSGPAFCPMMDSAPEQHSPGYTDIREVSYVEFDGGTLSYIEWIERDGKKHFAFANDDAGIPQNVRDFLADAISKDRAHA